MKLLASLSTESMGNDHGVVAPRDMASALMKLVYVWRGLLPMRGGSVKEGNFIRCDSRSRGRTCISGSRFQVRKEPREQLCALFRWGKGTGKVMYSSSTTFVVVEKNGRGEYDENILLHYIEGTSVQSMYCKTAVYSYCLRPSMSRTELVTR